MRWFNRCLYAVGMFNLVCNWLATRLVDTSTAHIQSELPDSLPECRICQLPQPPQTHHCKVCNKCIVVRDHHCYFTGQTRFSYFTNHSIQAVV